MFDGHTISCQFVSFAGYGPVQTWISSWVLAYIAYELRHDISNNVVCATSKVSDQPAHTRSLIRAFASLLNIL